MKNKYMNTEKFNAENVEDILKKIEKHLKEQLSKTNSNDEFLTICLILIGRLVHSVKPCFPDKNDKDELLNLIWDLYLETSE